MAQQLLNDDYCTPYLLPIGKPPAGSGTGNTVLAESSKPGRLNLPLGVNGTDEGME